MSQVIKTIEKQTINRGLKSFIISQDAKGYFAHELGELTQWSKVFGGGELKAHRLNPNKRYGNQYIRSWKPKPFRTELEAIQAIENQANTNVQYF